METTSPKFKLKTREEISAEKRRETMALKSEEREAAKIAKIRICITLDKDVTQKIQARAKKLRMSFSAYLNTLLGQQPNL